MRLFEVHELHGHQGSGFGAQAALAEMNTSETCGFGCTYLFKGEVAFGADQHQGGMRFAEDVEEEGLFALRGDVGGGVAMGDEFVAVEGQGDEVAQSKEWVDRGFEGFVALLHRTYHDFFDTLRLEDFPLGVGAIQEVEGVETDFGGFFCQPLHSIHAFGWGDGQGNVGCPRLLPRLLLADINAALGVFSGFGERDGAVEERAFSIGRPDGVALFHAQHAEGMGGFVFGKPEGLSEFGGVEKVLLFHK